METENLSVFYGDQQAIKEVSLPVHSRQVLALIGPSGCGKSTFLRCLNRMNDPIPGARLTGHVRLDGVDVYDRQVDPVKLRARVGMVFQEPNPFPKSIYDNIAFGPRMNGLASKREQRDHLVQSSLERAGLWEEVKDRLHHMAMSLSGGQQQRLCIARAIAMQPEVILMDEPASSLDPNSTAQIEELIARFKERFTIVIVTHNLQQAERIADRLAFFHLGKMVEVGATKQLFENPQQPLTQDYIQGRYG